MIFLLHHALEQSAQKYPAKDAFRCMSQRLSFQELDRKSNQLANALLTEGLQAGDRVGIFLNRGIDVPVALYGIFKAGGVAVPLDPFAPAQRIRFVLEDCQIQILISNTQHRRALKKLDLGSTPVTNVLGPKVDLEVGCRDWEEILSSSDLAPTIGIMEHDLAYIMYTSGTTGVPKGIMHTHHSGLAYARLSGSLYGVCENDIVANHSPLHFDISTFGYFTAPLFGATTIICSDAETKIPNSLAKVIDREQVTIWYSVPLALAQMLQGGILSELSWASLRWVLYGGEPFPTRTLRQLLAKTPQARWSNVYGPAEVNQCTYFHFNHTSALGDSVPLGHIWENTEMLIVNEMDEPVTNGEQGELLIRSATMMSGYWNQESRNQQAFFKKKNTPFDQFYYRTGDLVTINEDGLLYFQGRKDRQVKIRGYRIELDEIQAALDTLESLQEAAVYVEDKEEQKTLAAAVVSKEDQEKIIREIRQYLATKVPSYCIPEKVVVLQSIPRTSAGKVDHRALVDLS